LKLLLKNKYNKKIKKIYLNKNLINILNIIY